MSFVLGTVDTSGKTQEDYRREEQMEEERMDRLVQNMDIAIHNRIEDGGVPFDIPESPLDTSEQEVKAALKQVAVKANYIKDPDSIKISNLRLEKYDIQNEEANLYEYSATVFVRGVGMTRILLVHGPGEIHVFDVRGDVKYM